METDAEYYFRRARQERTAASQSLNRAVHDRHLELAQAYEFRGREMTAAGIQQLRAFEPRLEVTA